uniref:Uncharacterized protein n=1 Tax=Davidia involucrata TaxID=16924 RepID=A0A5B7BFX8_DAVIN
MQSYGFDLNSNQKGRSDMVDALIQNNCNGIEVARAPISSSSAWTSKVIASESNIQRTSGDALKLNENSQMNVLNQIANEPEGNNGPNNTLLQNNGPTGAKAVNRDGGPDERIQRKLSPKAME